MNDKKNNQVILCNFYVIRYDGHHLKKRKTRNTGDFRAAQLIISLQKVDSVYLDCFSPFLPAFVDALVFVVSLVSSL